MPPTTASVISDKYLALHASFQVLKKDLSRLQITCIDIPGILSGSPMSYILLCQEIFLSPARRELREICTQTYRLSPAMTDYRFCDTILRIARMELGLSSRLSTEQFLNNGNFIIRRIELLSDIAKAVYKREGYHEKVAVTCSTVTSGGSVSSMDPPPSSMSTILDLIREINSKIISIDSKVTEKFETIQARLSILETRFKIFETN
jgi:hypothetical protein